MHIRPEQFVIYQIKTTITTANFGFLLLIVKCYLLLSHDGAAATYIHTSLH